MVKVKPVETEDCIASNHLSAITLPLSAAAGNSRPGRIARARTKAAATLSLVFRGTSAAELNRSSGAGSSLVLAHAALSANLIGAWMLNAEA